MTRIHIRALSALLLLFVGFGIPAEPEKSAYHVVKKIPVGGDGGWDYLTMDADAGRLYVTRSTRVQVVDAEGRPEGRRSLLAPVRRGYNGRKAFRGTVTNSAEGCDAGDLTARGGGTNDPPGRAISLG